MEQSIGLDTSMGEYHNKSGNIQSDVNWSGFFGNHNSVSLNLDNDHTELNNTNYGYKGIYKGDCIKEKATLTPTQIFCADTNEVGQFVHLVTLSNCS